ncbi:MAG: hypothetical protein IPK94_10225 [Saprospiraceae bacterium]|nr:hypothetical protein [Saprospiraceae bacterium]
MKSDAWQYPIQYAHQAIKIVSKIRLRSQLAKSILFVNSEKTGSIDLNALTFLWRTGERKVDALAGIKLVVTLLNTPYKRV